MLIDIAHKKFKQKFRLKIDKEQIQIAVWNYNKFNLVQ